MKAEPAEAGDQDLGEVSENEAHDEQEGTGESSAPAQ
jgi:hypothetical protein